MSELEISSSSVEELKLASRMYRLCAVFFDVLIIIVASIAFLYYTDVINRIKTTGLVSTSDLSMILIYSLLIFIIFHAYLLFKNGQTFGKWIFDISIVKKDGTKIHGLAIILKRSLPIYLLSFIPIFGALIGLVNIVFIIRKDRRCLHDIIAGTKVVQLEVPE